VTLFSYQYLTFSHFLPPEALTAVTIAVAVICYCHLTARIAGENYCEQHLRAKGNYAYQW